MSIVVSEKLCGWRIMELGDYAISRLCEWEIIGVNRTEGDASGTVADVFGNSEPKAKSQQLMANG